MSAPHGVLVRALLRAARVLLPAERQDDVLGDLLQSYEERRGRLGPGAAARRLVRETCALLAWRLGASLRVGDPESSAAMGSDARPMSRGSRATRRGRALAGDFLTDLRLACRTLARRPRFTLGAAAVLGVGIGSVSTVLTLLDRIYLERPAHVAEPERLVRLWRAFANGAAGGSLSHPDYRFYREGASTLAGLAAYDGGYPVAWSVAPGEADQLDAWFVSANYFDVLGVRPALGRFFLPEEDAAPGTHLVVVLSHAFWDRALARDPQVIGSPIELNGRGFTVVGVAPEGFRGTSPVEGTADAWVPIATHGALTRPEDEAWWRRVPHLRSNWLSVVGRVAPGVTFEAVRANLEALSASLSYEGREPGERLLVSRQYLYSPGQASLLARLSWMLLLVIGIVLAIAGANASLLLLSRATGRAREIGIRTALGAGRGRVIRLLLAESLALGLMGGALGLALSYGAADLLASFLPYAFGTSFTPDPTVLAATVLLSVMTGAVVGLAPAAAAARSDPAATIAGGIRPRARRRVREALVVGQIALSLVLVAGAALFARSFLAARAEPLGFETEDRLVVSLELGSQGFDEARRRAFLDEALERLEALPGVARATAAVMVPFQGEWTTSIPTPPGARATEADGRTVTGANLVAPGYFEVMGVPIVRGRPLGRGDARDSPPAAVINETLAGALWPGEDPLGRTLELRPGALFTVVGIAADATYYELGEEPRPQAYGSLLQLPAEGVSFLVETSGAAAALAPAVRSALREIEPTLAFDQVTTLASVVEDQTARYRVTAALVGLFAALALALAAAGLYAVVSFLVAQRTREIGVRMALGADRRRIAAQVLAGSARLALLGVTLGLALTLVLRGFAGSFLYRVEPGDPWSLAGACALLAAVTVLASLVPAGRASRVEPLEAVRTE